MGGLPERGQEVSHKCGPGERLANASPLRVVEETEGVEESDQAEETEEVEVADEVDEAEAEDEVEKDQDETPEPGDEEQDED